MEKQQKNKNCCHFCGWLQKWQQPAASVEELEVVEKYLRKAGLDASAQALEARRFGTIFPMNV